MASDDEEVYTPLWCPSIQDYYLCPWLHRLDDGTIAVAWVSAAEWTHRDQHRVEYGGLTPCSDPSEPPADELLAIESDADETSGGNDADEGRGDSFAFDSDTDGHEGPSGSGTAEPRPEQEQGQGKRKRGGAPAEGPTGSGRGHPEAMGATGVRGAAPMRTRHPVLHLHGQDGPSGSWTPRRVAPRF